MFHTPMIRRNALESSVVSPHSNTKPSECFLGCVTINAASKKDVINYFVGLLLQIDFH
jgi:hypothetical protein